MVEFMLESSVVVELADEFVDVFESVEAAELMVELVD
jgi:hypothetical protein